MKRQNLNYEPLIVFLLCTIGNGAFSVFLGQDINWDLKNYHFYNPYAFLNDQMFVDIAPAQLQSFLNPFSDLLFYFLIVTLKPIWVGFSLGAIQGLNYFLIYKLLSLPEFKLKESVPKILFALVFLSAMCGRLNFALIGTTFQDNLLSLFVLSSFYLLLKHFKDMTHKILITSGLFFGIGVGLKLTLAMYFLGFLSLLWIANTMIRNKISYSAVFGLSVGVGFLLSNGYWMVTLYKAFGNPFFPFFNGIFQSEFYMLSNFADRSFLPQGLVEHLFHPFYFAFDSTKVSELIFFKDIRYLLCYGGVFAFLIYLIRVREKVDSFTIAFISFFVISYLFWQVKFSIYRYLIVLEYIAPLVLLLILNALIPKVKTPFIKEGFFGLLIIVSLVLYKQERWDWGRLKPWQDSFFGLDETNTDPFKHATILMTGGEPTAYIIPYFDASTSFVRLESNMYSLTEQYKFSEVLIEKIKFSKNLYLLGFNEIFNLDKLRAFGRFESNGLPKMVKTHLDTFYLFPLLLVNDDTQ